jgi:hypothetical protein
MEEAFDTGESPANNFTDQARYLSFSRSPATRIRFFFEA